MRPERLNMCLAEFAINYDTLDGSGKDGVLGDDKNYIKDNGLAKGDAYKNEAIFWRIVKDKWQRESKKPFWEHTVRNDRRTQGVW